jgi:tetraacyldisaccharide 4'-kinase
MRGGHESEEAAAVKRGGAQVIDLRTFSPVYEMRGWRKALLAPVAYPLSLVYALGIRGWRRRRVEGRDVGAPVISVGSIAVGGTGKTPLSMLIAESLRGRGMAVAVVSRGYKRKTGASPLIVSDRAGVRANVEEAGDEPYLMALRLKGVPVIVDPDRVRGAVRAKRVFEPEVILLDDGFQCRGIGKCLDIVTLGPDALRPGAGYLPWGPLREGMYAIGSDDFIVYVARSDAERNSAGWGGDRAPPFAGLRESGHFYFASYAGPVMVDGGGNAAGPGGALDKALVVSGIARPEGFESTCREIGVEAGAKMRFDDHHWYSEADGVMIERVMEERGCDWLVTTEKDLHKLPPDLRARARAVRVNLCVEDASFMDAVAERVVCGSGTVGDR